MFSHSCPFKALRGKARQRIRPIKTGFRKPASVDVIDAFKVASCDDTVLEDFPACMDPTIGCTHPKRLRWCSIMKTTAASAIQPPSTYTSLAGGGATSPSVMRAYHISLMPRACTFVKMAALPTSLFLIGWLRMTTMVTRLTRGHRACECSLWGASHMTDEDLVFCEMCAIHQTCSDNMIKWNSPTAKGFRHSLGELSLPYLRRN
jgi:hypothetical protein